MEGNQADGQVHNFKFYVQSQNFTKIVSNRKTIFGIWGLFGYIIQFLLICTVINSYCDRSRFCPCNDTRDLSEINCDDHSTKWENSEVYDTALLLLGVYHIIEWVRVIIFLVAVFLGANMIKLYYILYINTIFGLAAYIMAHVYRFSGDGPDCSDSQPERAATLVAEVVIFWTTYHIMNFPQIVLCLMSHENKEDAINGPKEEEEENNDNPDQVKKD